MFEESTQANAAGTVAISTVTYVPVIDHAAGTGREGEFFLNILHHVTQYLAHSSAFTGRYGSCLVKIITV